ncbi:MAG: LCP family protein [Intrasporangium sp.]|uniref:LCP family protein n=1 Tax=Intrasporangium sp. TaxID=1925024 RepID=UPI0026496F1D|nr:LCP family protein [Intrasporangium sp.]MDN5794910.1 LCP family protein [Intrasporangium sp.]
MVAAPRRRVAAPESRETLRRDLAHHFRRALGLTALGTVIPGAGLTRTRSRVIGWVLVGITVLAVATVAWFLLTHGVMKSGLALIGRPELLRVAAMAFVVGGLVWCASIILTAIRARPVSLDRTRTRLLAAFTTVMVLLVGGTSYKAAEYASITQDTIQSVFQAPPNRHGAVDGPELVEGPDPWANTPRVNILLLGSDAGVGRVGTRTDSMIVASINTQTGNTVLISLPRNLQYVPIPKASPLRRLYPSGVYGKPYCIRQQADPSDGCLLNAIWTEADQFAADHPGSFPGVASPGRDTIRDVISEVVGLKIDHTVVIDLKGFVQLVDAMGGVEIDVKEGAYGGKLPIGGHVTASGLITGVKGYFEPGRQHLDGWHTLWYARTRAADDDYSRMGRQRCVIKAVVGQVNPAAMLARYAEVVRIAKDNIYTDIPSANLSAYVDLIERVQQAKITSVALDPKHGVNTADPDFDVIHREIKKALNPPKPKAKPVPTGTSRHEAVAPTPTRTPAPKTTTSATDDDEC